MSMKYDKNLIKGRDPELRALKEVGRNQESEVRNQLFEGSRMRLTG